MAVGGVDHLTERPVFKLGGAFSGLGDAVTHDITTAVKIWQGGRAISVVNSQ